MEADVLEQFNLLKQTVLTVQTKLVELADAQQQNTDAIVQKVEAISISNLVTKEDIATLATKADIQALSTKEDLKSLATLESLNTLASKEDVKDIVTINQNTANIPQALTEIKDIVLNYDKSLQDSIDEVVSLKEIYNELASVFSEKVSTVCKTIDQYIVELKAAANVYTQGASDLGDAMSESSELVSAIQSSVSSMIANTSVINDKVQQIQSNIETLANISSSILSSIRFNTKVNDIADAADDFSGALLNLKNIFTKKRGDL